MRKYFILILAFYFLILFQGSFLGNFSKDGVNFNLILVSVFLLNFLSEDKGNFGIFAGILGGTTLDTFSFLPFGVFTLSLVLSIFCCKKLFPIFQKSNIFSTALLFLAFWFCFRLILISVSTGLNFLLQKNFILFFPSATVGLMMEFLLNFLIVVFALLFSSLKK